MGHPVSIEPASSYSWFGNYSFYKKRQLFFETPCSTKTTLKVSHGLGDELLVWVYFGPDLGIWQNNCNELESSYLAWNHFKTTTFHQGQNMLQR